MKTETIEERIVAELIDRQLTITTAESCTGGLLGATLVNVPGVSEVYKEGYITYSDEAKEKLLGVSAETIFNYGVVSEQTAKEMAMGAARTAEADIALSTTGVAGPDGGSAEHPVGEVYIGCYYRGKTVGIRFLGKGDRMAVRTQAVHRALELLEETMRQEETA